jgi:hypothetical protein
VVTNQDLALERLMDPAFDPAQSVLVERDPWPGQAAAATNHAGGVVQFERYQSKRLELSAEAAGPSVLLLNDKYHPGWEVRIDGRPASGFRANYLMRGVAVPPGKHAITFQFEVRARALWISVAALLCVGLWILAQAVKVLMTIRRRAAESRT